MTVPDDGLWKRPRRVNVAELIEDFDVAPHGERAVFVARGEVFSVPISKGPDPQPHRQLRRPRPVRGLVAGRRHDRLHLRRERRGRDLARGPGRHGAGPAAQQRPRGAPVRAGVVARQRPDRVLGQGRQALRGDRGGRPRGPGRGPHLGRDLRLCVVAGRRPPRLQPGQPGAGLAAPHLERRRRQAAHRDLGVLRGDHAGLEPGRHVPLLPLQPELCADHLGPRVELRRRPARRHLRAGAEEGRQAAAAARERRGEARNGRGRRRRRRREGRAEGKDDKKKGKDADKDKARRPPRSRW